MGDHFDGDHFDGDPFDGNHFDDLETRDPAQRETALFEAVRAQIAHARANTGYYAEALASIDPAAITDRDALAALPVTRKSDLIALQQRTPPFGGLLAVAPGALARIYQSPGPIYDADGHGEDPWRFGPRHVCRGLAPRRHHLRSGADGPGRYRHVCGLAE